MVIPTVLSSARVVCRRGSDRIVYLPFQSVFGDPTGIMNILLVHWISKSKTTQIFWDTFTRYSFETHSTIRLASAQASSRRDTMPRSPEPTSSARVLHRVLGWVLAICSSRRLLKSEAPAPIVIVALSRREPRQCVDACSQMFPMCLSNNQHISASPPTTSALRFGARRPRE